MKLASVSHLRCEEIKAETLVWVADDMPSSVLHAYAKAAQELFLKNAEELNKATRVPAPGYEPRYALYPDKTVAEIQAIHQVEVAAYKEYSAKQIETRKPFAELLEEVSEGRIKQFFGIPPALEITISWGHRHGTLIEYGEVDVYSKDFNASESEL